MKILLLVLSICAYTALPSTIASLSSFATRRKSIQARDASSRILVDALACPRPANRKFRFIPPCLSGSSPDEKLIELSKIYLPSEKIIQKAFYDYKHASLYAYRWSRDDYKFLINESPLSPEQKIYLEFRLDVYIFNSDYNAKSSELAMIDLVRSLRPDLKKNVRFEVVSGRASPGLGHLSRDVLRRLDPDFIEHALHAFKRIFIDEMIQEFKAPLAKKLLDIWNSCKHSNDLGYPVADLINIRIIVSTVFLRLKQSSDPELNQLNQHYLIFERMLWGYYSFTVPFMAALELHGRGSDRHFVDWIRTPHLDMYKKTKRTYSNE